MKIFSRLFLPSLRVLLKPRRAATEGTRRRLRPTGKLKEDNEENCDTLKKISVQVYVLDKRYKEGENLLLDNENEKLQYCFVFPEKKLDKARFTSILKLPR